MAAVLPTPRIGPRERLSATMAFSLIAFGVLILGIGFSRDDAAPVVPDRLPRKAFAMRSPASTWNAALLEVKDTCWPPDASV